MLLAIMKYYQMKVSLIYLERLFQITRITILKRSVLLKIDNKLSMFFASRRDSAFVRDRVTDDPWGKVLG